METVFNFTSDQCVNLYFLIDKILPNLSLEPNPSLLEDLKALSKILSEILGTSTCVIEEYTGKIHQMSLDTHSCRLLQNALDTRDADVVNKIYEEIIDHIADLMSDPIGNYLCQKLIELMTEKQRSVLLTNCKSSLVLISNNLHGTRSVQKLIDVIKTDDEFTFIINEFQEHVIEMIHDLNGNHVIKKCIQRMESSDKSQFIYDKFVLNCVEVATSVYGAVIFNTAVDCGTISQKLQLFDAVDTNAISLILHPYGNYVVQHILNLKLDPNFPTKIAKRITGQVYHFSKQKVSSNVIEKCLKEGDSDCVKRLMNELLFNPNLRMSGSKIYSPAFIKERAKMQLIELLQDNYGNYVIQTCLNESKEKASKEYKMMIDLLLPVWSHFRFTLYGKKINCHFINL